MRTVHEPQMSFGEIDISKIKLNPKCRDDIPAILSGLQFIYVTPDLHDSVFNILKTVIPKRVNDDSACRDETPTPEKLRGRCDSFVLETNVHFPTYISLLFDAMRKSTIESARLAELYEAIRPDKLIVA